MGVLSVSTPAAVAAASRARVGVLGGVTWRESGSTGTSLSLRWRRGDYDSVGVNDSVDDNLPGTEEGRPTLHLRLGFERDGWSDSARDENTEKRQEDGVTCRVRVEGSPIQDEFRVLRVNQLYDNNRKVRKVLGDAV